MTTEPDQQAPAVAPALRVQMLSTEHWSLLATRGLTWSEVMSRITIHLTVTSAALVVLALVVQSSGFGTTYHVLSIGMASVLLLLGLLTGVRVWNASEEDIVLIAAMNRIRAAYLELDPSLSDVFLTSAYDDPAGIASTVTMGVRRRTLSHVAGGTSMFINAVNTIVAGALGAVIAQAAGASAEVVALAGVVAAAICLVALGAAGRRRFGRGALIPVRHPTPGLETSGHPTVQ